MLQRSLVNLASRFSIVHRYWARAMECERIYRLPRSELDARVQEKLKRLLRRAASSVPYYRRMFEQRGWNPGRAEEYWQEWPVLTQRQLQEHRDDLIADGVDTKTLRLAHSSGSSGFIKTFYHSRNYYAMNVPQTYWMDSLAGWRPGVRRAKLWGAGKDVKRAQQTVNRIRAWFRHDRMFNSYAMDDQIMRRYHDELTDFRPQILLAYAGSVFEFARFLSNNNLTPSYPRTSIISSAEPLTPVMRDAVVEAFGRPVFDRYGSREVGTAAGECEMHDGLHIAIMHTYVEIVRPGSLEQIWDQEGDVLVTTLGEPDVPLIRYQIGDAAVASRKRCPCGRNTPMLDAVKGRDHDFIKMSDGRRLHGGAFSRVVYGMSHVRRFAVTQKSFTHIIFKVVAVRPLTDEERRTMLAGLEVVLTPDVTVDIQEVEEIPPLPSGKYKFIVSELADD